MNLKEACDIVFYLLKCSEEINADNSSQANVSNWLSNQLDEAHHNLKEAFLNFRERDDEKSPEELLIKHEFGQFYFDRFGVIWCKT